MTLNYRPTYDEFTRMESLVNRERDNIQSQLMTVLSGDFIMNPVLKQWNSIIEDLVDLSIHSDGDSVLRISNKLYTINDSRPLDLFGSVCILLYDCPWIVDIIPEIHQAVTICVNAIYEAESDLTRIVRSLNEVASRTDGEPLSFLYDVGKYYVLYRRGIVEGDTFRETSFDIIDKFRLYHKISTAVPLPQIRPILESDEGVSVDTNRVTRYIQASLAFVLEGQMPSINSMMTGIITNYWRDEQGQEYERWKGIIDGKASVSYDRYSVGGLRVYIEGRPVSMTKISPMSRFAALVVLLDSFPYLESEMHSVSLALAELNSELDQEFFSIFNIIERVHLLTTGGSFTKLKGLMDLACYFSFYKEHVMNDNAFHFESLCFIHQLRIINQVHRISSLDPIDPKYVCEPSVLE